MKNYQEILSEFVTLPHPYYQVGDKLFQSDLNNMVKFHEYLGCPGKKLKFIHVAGTNGKGSCVNYLAAVFMSMGIKVGVYESPHIKDCRERIKINGEMISQESFCEFWSIAEGYIYGDERARKINPLWRKPPYSEVFIAMSFYYFAKEEVDIAIIEVGVGGRLDPTNIIDQPLISIISSIGFDHVKLLGSTLEDIAREKCGIIKYNCPVVVGNVTDSVKQVILEEAEKHDAPYYFADDYYESENRYNKIAHDSSYDLKGCYQAFNIRTILSAISVLNQSYPMIMPMNVSPEEIKTALRNTAKMTGFKGRWEILCEKPYVICDVCDNLFGFEFNIEQLKSLKQTNKHNRLVIMLGLASFDHIGIRDILPEDAEYIFTRSGGTMDAHALCNAMNMCGKVTDSIAEAIDYYWTNKEDEDILYIGGSVFLMDDVYNAFGKYVIVDN